MHHVRTTVELLRRETPDFIPPQFWPPNSPDINRVDYRIWAVMPDRVYRQPVRVVDELIDSWSSIQQTVIDEAIDQ